MWNVTRQDKGLFVLLVDQSAYGRNFDLASLADRVIYSRCLSFSFADGLRDLLDVSVLGYSVDSDGKPLIYPALPGQFSGRDVVPLPELASNPFRIDTTEETLRDEATGELLVLPQMTPHWVEQRPGGYGPLGLALLRATLVVDSWIARHPSSPPPVVLNITAGAFRGADPEPYASALCSRTTRVGKVVLGHAIELASSISRDPPDFMSCLARLHCMSSELPDDLCRAMQAAGEDVSLGSRWFTINNSTLATRIANLILFYDD